MTRAVSGCVELVIIRANSARPEPFAGSIFDFSVKVTASCRRGAGSPSARWLPLINTCSSVPAAPSAIPGARSAVGVRASMAAHCCTVAVWLFAVNSPRRARISMVARAGISACANGPAVPILVATDSNAARTSAAGIPDNGFFTSCGGAGESLMT